MRGAPQSGFEMLMLRMSCRISSGVLGRPPLSIANRLGNRRGASGSLCPAEPLSGTSRDSKTNNRRSTLLNAGLFGDLRPSTLV